MRAAALLLAALLLGGFGCERPARHEARGIVRDVKRDAGQVLIEHDDIPGLMPAMTMSFDVPSPELLEKLERGQRIEFVVAFDGRSYRVVEAEVVGSEESPGGAFEALPAPRDPAPDFTLTDQAGRSLSLRSLRGRTLVVDFIYTHCPGPCPIQTSRHVALQRELSPELRARTWFVSISLDPERDTPEALRAYAEERGADLENWSFLTGPPETVDALLRSYGVGRIPQENGEIDHILVTFLVDAEGRIAERYLGLDHSAAELLQALERIAG